MIVDAKRVFDYTIALIGLVLFSPLWVVIVFLIYIDSGWPIYYVQKRIGKNGVPFKVLKFRSMKVGMEQITFDPKQLQKQDPRITAMGRILRKGAMDELPQIINILKGEMSFVGPRPLIPETVEKALAEVEGFEFNLSVKPGLTGIAQIYAPKVCSNQERLKFTRIYAQKQGVWYDFKLMARSLYVSVVGKWDIVGGKAG